MSQYVWDYEWYQRDLQAAIIAMFCKKPRPAPTTATPAVLSDELMRGNTE